MNAFKQTKSSGYAKSWTERQTLSNRKTYKQTEMNGDVNKMDGEKHT